MKAYGFPAGEFRDESEHGPASKYRKIKSNNRRSTRRNQRKVLRSRVRAALRDYENSEIFME